MRDHAPRTATRASESTARPGRGQPCTNAAESYRVISFTIEPHDLVRTLPVAYPESEVYHFEPLDERVPVYQRPFTLVQEVVLEGNMAAQQQLRGSETITINGTLDYQACDDEICFNPVSLPVSWTVSLRPVVFQRPGR